MRDITHFGKKIIIIAAFVLLAGMNIFLAGKFVEQENELKVLRVTENGRMVNQGIIQFAKLFVETVLGAGKEVDFETRLRLEVAVRDLNDPEIMERWDGFVNSKDEKDAQNAVIRLLQKLLEKV